MVFNTVETHTMKRSPSSPWNNSLHHSISICEVKLKIIMETHEPLGRLPGWRNKLYIPVCGPCFLLCCVCFFPFFQLLSTMVHQYDNFTSGCAKQFTICVGLIYMDKQSINSKLHLMPRKSEFLLWKIPGALIQFVERIWISVESYWKPISFLKPVFFF